MPPTLFAEDIVAAVRFVWVFCEKDSGSISEMSNSCARFV